MSEAFINQVTLDCLLNKEMFGKHLKYQKSKLINKQERKFYKKRIFSLFKELLLGNEPTGLLPDVKYAYENFSNACIHYFKAIDNNDLIQAEYDNIEIKNNENNENNENNSVSEEIELNNYKDNFSQNTEADKILMRSIKMEIPTLDKYVKKTSTKKKENIILPKQKTINLQDPELKNKGLKKKNITNKYEDNTKKEDT
jgi:hypothetical protein